MKAFMDRGKHHEAVQRALALGRTEDPANLCELIGLLQSASVNEPTPYPGKDTP